MDLRPPPLPCRGKTAKPNPHALYKGHFYRVPILYPPFVMGIMTLQALLQSTIKAGHHSGLYFSKAWESAEMHEFSFQSPITGLCDRSVFCPPPPPPLHRAKISGVCQCKNCI